MADMTVFSKDSSLTRLRGFKFIDKPAHVAKHKNAEIVNADAMTKAQKRREKRRLGGVGRFFLRLFGWLLLIILVAGLFYFVALPKIKEAFNVSYTQKIEEAILGEAVTKSELIIVTIPATVTKTIEGGFLNIPAFTKSKTVKTVGNGSYIVDLNDLTAQSITIDTEAKTVTITVPRAQFHELNIDPNLTEYEETERGWLAMGDIKLTQEQQQLFDLAVRAEMLAMLDTTENLAFADEVAIEKLTALFAPLVTAVSDSYTLSVVMPNS